VEFEEPSDVGSFKGEKIDRGASTPGGDQIDVQASTTP